LQPDAVVVEVQAAVVPLVLVALQNVAHVQQARQRGAPADAQDRDYVLQNLNRKKHTTLPV